MSENASPTHDREKLVERLMRRDNISGEEAEALVEQLLQDRASDIDPALLKGLDLG